MSEQQADIILDFLYLVAKNYNKPEKDQEAESLGEIELWKKAIITSESLLFIQYDTIG
jgi:hypothetical protein